MNDKGKAVSSFTVEDVKEIVRAAREPSEEEKAKQKKEKELQDRRRKEAIILAKEEEEAVRKRQANCSHLKESGKTAVMGQVHSDGLYHPLCIKCQKEFTPVEPPEAVR